MAEFNKITITKAGISLFNQILANNDKIQFTKVVTSPNIYPVNQIPDLTELANVKQETLINDISILPDDTIKLKVIVSNETLAESYTINSVRYICKR